MTSNNKDILIAKIDVLWQSVSDPQLQTVIGLMRDLVVNVDVLDTKEIGFGMKVYVPGEEIKPKE